MRDLLKTISFGALHFVVGFSVAYALSGSLVIAGGIGFSLILAMFFTPLAYKIFADLKYGGRQTHGGQEAPAAGSGRRVCLPRTGRQR